MVCTSNANLDVLRCTWDLVFAVSVVVLVYFFANAYAKALSSCTGTWVDFLPVHMETPKTARVMHCPSLPLT